MAESYVNNGDTHVACDTKDNLLGEIKDYGNTDTNADYVNDYGTSSNTGKTDGQNGCDDHDDANNNVSDDYHDDD